MHSSIKYWYGTIGVLQPRDVEMARPSTCSWGALCDRQEKDAIDKYLHHRVAGAIEKQSVDNEGRVVSPWESQRLLLKGQETGIGTQYGWSSPKKKIVERFQAKMEKCSWHGQSQVFIKCRVTEKYIHREIIGKSVNQMQNAFKRYCLSGDTVAFDTGYLFVLHTLLKMYCLHVRGNFCDWRILHSIECSTLIIVNP